MTSDLYQCALEDVLVTILERIGGEVTTDELAYQLGRRGYLVSGADLAGALYELEEQGRIAPSRWRLT